MASVVQIGDHDAGLKVCYIFDVEGLHRANRSNYDRLGRRSLVVDDRSTFSTR